MKTFFSYGIVALTVSAMATSFAAKAEWGTQQVPSVVYETNKAITGVQSVRTPDGKTFISWLDYTGIPHWGYNVYLMLLDENGNNVWGDPLEVENRRNCSWCAAYFLIATPDGDAIISWEDARADDEKPEAGDTHDPVLYRINQQGQHVWDKDGVTFSKDYIYPPKLYLVGNGGLLASFVTSANTNVTKLALLSPSSGKILGTPVVMNGEIFPVSDKNFINVYPTSEGTVAMKYDLRFKKVWNKAAVVSDYIYEGHSRFPYGFVSDGNGGAFVTFMRFIGNFAQVPVLQYVSGDGEAVFGPSVDIIGDESLTVGGPALAVNLESEKLFGLWTLTRGRYEVGAQTLDFYGEYEWGDLGKNIVSKKSPSGYGYKTIAARAISGGKWIALYADQHYWNHSQGFISMLDENGEVISSEEFGVESGLNDIRVWFDNNDIFMVYENEVMDDNWKKTYSIETIRIEDYDPDAPSVVDMPVADPQGKDTYHSLDGMRLDRPSRGINIVRHSDGKVEKMIVK